MRWITAALFVALLAWLFWSFKGFRAPQIFQIFAEATFFYCLIAGTAWTADSLSSEKRDGTMGLLFLTNLNGAEIIAGKLCSRALGAAYGFFAIFPLMAVQMLLGGITLGQFWRTVLALVNAIFFSVAAGFLASSVCVRQFTAIALGTGLALFFSIGLVCAAAVANAFRRGTTWFDGLAMFSPLCTLRAVGRGRAFGPNFYWWSILAVTSISCLWLALATWRVARSWRDTATGAPRWFKFRFLPSRRQGGTAGSLAFRRRLLGINAFFWLGSRNLVCAPIFMVILVLVVALTSYVGAPYFGRVITKGPFSPMVGHLFAWLWAGLLIHALALYYAAMVASRRLAEDKQNGALELVLSTPTSERSISRGLWMAYARRMFFPATAAILVHVFFLWQIATMALLDSPSSALPPGTTAAQVLWNGLLNQPVRGVNLGWAFTMALRMVALSLVTFVSIWFTLGWLARWLGLRMKHPGFAPIISLALALAPPVLIFTLACYCADAWHLNRMPDRIFVPMMMWVAFGIAVGHCTLLSVWAAGRLRNDFRTVVTSRFQPASLRPWWKPTRRTCLRVAIGSAAAMGAIAILILCDFAYQNWASRRAWAAFQNQLKQRNESLEVAALLPRPVPENQNFALTPEFRDWVHVGESDFRARHLFAALEQLYPDSSMGNNAAGIEWSRPAWAPLDRFLGAIGTNTNQQAQGNRADFANALLPELKPFEPAMQGLAARAQLPYFQPSTNRDLAEVLQRARKDNKALERLQQLFTLRACALLATGHNTPAVENLLGSLQLCRLARQLPDAHSSLRTQYMLARSLQPLWEGLVVHCWTESQLGAFQAELSAFNLLSDHTNAIHRLMVANVALWRDLADGKKVRQFVGVPPGLNYSILWRLQPRTWWLDNCIRLYQAGHRAIERVDVAGMHVRFENRWPDFDGVPLDQETVMFLLQPEWGGTSPALVVFAQTAVNQGIIACALERYRLAQGRYPENLDQLVPAFLAAIPNDVARGRPMLYENTTNGLFVLRSVGPNGTIDRNKIGSDDWLWSFPTNAPPAVAR